MARNDTVLLVMPNQHLMSYASTVLREVASMYRYSGLKIVELAGYDAVPSKIDGALEEYDPILVVMIGHGLEDRITSECMQPYMSVGDDRVRKMSGRVVVLVSCLTAKELGPDIVEKGALAYYGSSNELLFFIGLPPGWGRATKSVFYCELQTLISLLAGRTTMEAHEDRLKRYEEEIEYWLTGPGKDSTYAPLMTNLLIVDKNIATFLGNNVKISEGVATVQPTVSVPPIIPSLPVFLGFVLLKVK